MDSLSIKLQPEEHGIWRRLKRLGLSGHTFIIAVSGGADSALLALIIWRLRRLHKNKIIIAHVHHGIAKSASLTRYRNRSQKWVENFAKKLAVPFLTNVIDDVAGDLAKNLRVLHSENDLREFRYSVLKKWVETATTSSRPAVVLLGHHADDLLETQMMRLIRGAGPQGFASMVYYADGKLRPLLDLRRSEILKLAKKLKLKWCEDPSNKILDPLRNWMRHEWLKSLEKRSTGATDVLIRSLALLAQQLQAAPQIQGVTRAGELRRPEYLALSLPEQKSTVARYLKLLKIKNYSHGHVEEIVRRLDNSRGEYKFTLLKHEWRINAGRIRAAKI